MRKHRNLVIFNDNSDCNKVEYFISYGLNLCTCRLFILHSDDSEEKQILWCLKKKNQNRFVGEVVLFFQTSKIKKKKRWNNKSKP